MLFKGRCMVDNDFLISTATLALSKPGRMERERRASLFIPFFLYPDEEAGCTEPRLLNHVPLLDYLLWLSKS